MLRTILAAMLLFASALAAAAAGRGRRSRRSCRQYAAVIAKGSRQGIEPAIDALASSGLPAAQRVLEKWQDKAMYLRKSDGLFFWGEEQDGKYRAARFRHG